MLRNLATAGVAILLALLAIETAGQLVMLLWPSYEVVFLEPDPVLGWKQAPHHRYTWTGTHWWAADFSVPITTNADGFRDVDRRPGRVPNVERVAVIGDSFVEALQVPFEKTATQLLEKRLNAVASPGVRWEVLNVGISNFGVGQYLLAWEEYARRFEPRTVFVFVSRTQMRRTPARSEMGGFRSTFGTWLWIRPTFWLDREALVREPPADYEALVAIQRELIAGEFGGSRSRRRRTSVVRHYLAPLLPTAAPPPPRRRPPPRHRPIPARRATRPRGDRELLRLNLKIIEEIGRQVRATGGRLAVVGASPFEDPRVLAGFCREHGFGYVPLGPRMRRLDVQTLRWAHDAHFNEAGNEVFAAALFEWMQTDGRMAPAPRRGTGRQ